MTLQDLRYDHSVQVKLLRRAVGRNKRSSMRMWPGRAAIFLITLRARLHTSSSWLCKSPNFRQEIRSSYYRNDSLKYDLKYSMSQRAPTLRREINRFDYFS